MDFETRVGAYALILENGSLLLTHLVPEAVAPPVPPGVDPGWTLPGGGLEAGEDPEGAAVREVLEETGLVVELTRLLGTSSLHVRPQDRAPGKRPVPLHSLRIVYEARVISGELKIEVNGSTDDVRWSRVDEVPNMPRVSLVDEALRLWKRSRQGEFRAADRLRRG